MRDRVLKCLVLFLIPLFALAEEQAKEVPALGIGQIAENFLGPIGLLSDLISTTCFIIGGSFLFASLIKYIEHRRSPLMVPISTVIYMFLLGLILVFLPFLSLFTDTGGIGYTLLKK